MKKTDRNDVFSPDKYFEKILSADPNLRRVPEFDPTDEFEGIHAVTFDSSVLNGKKTKVFAYMAHPENADCNTPGIVLIHGGGGHAFLPWVKMWRDRGYSVIAPDTVGHMPTARNAGCTETNADWTNGLHGVFEEDGYTAAPNNDDMQTYSLPFEDRWLTHITAQCILSFTALAECGLADKDKIGISGISWGAVALSYYLGFDRRAAFAIPIYGSGYLSESLAWMRDKFSHPETQRYFLAEERFYKADMPILWLCWNDDCCFSINSNSKSYIDTAQNNPLTSISIVDKMYHSHAFAWMRPESEAFANSIVKNGRAPQRFTSLPNADSLECTYEYDGQLTANLFYITEDLTYSTHEKYGMVNTFMDAVWNCAPLHPENGKIIGEIPHGAHGYYIELTNENSVVISTPYIKTER